MYRLTVATETPACLATSRIVTESCRRVILCLGSRTRVTGYSNRLHYFTAPWRNQYALLLKYSHNCPKSTRIYGLVSQTSVGCRSSGVVYSELLLSCPTSLSPTRTQ